MMDKKKERKYETHLIERNADLTKVWGEVVSRIRKGVNHERRHER